MDSEVWGSSSDLLGIILSFSPLMVSYKEYYFVVLYDKQRGKVFHLNIFDKEKSKHPNLCWRETHCQLSDVWNLIS